MNRKEEIIESLKTYSIPIVLGLITIGMVFISSSQQRDIDELSAGIAAYEKLEAESEQTLADLDVAFDKESQIEVIEGRTVSAEKIGEAMIAVDDALTAFYKTNEPLPEDEAERAKIFAELEKNQIENTKLTGATAADHIDTWKLNPEWTTKLESVVVYQDTPRIPVVFSMTTKDGESAGLIFATYDADNLQLTNIVKHYTRTGMNDAVDVGGI